MVSGTRNGSDWRADTGTSERFSRGTATACLTCTIPTTSSMLSSITGKRERPVVRASSMTSNAESVRSTLFTRGRGVITS